MKKHFYPVIMLILVILAGCRKKEYPEPASASASYFYAKLMFDNQPVEITTGKSGNYMYTFYTMDSAGVYNLIGEFKQPGCSTCANSLRIQINDSKISSPNSAIMIDSALQVRSYGYLSGFNGPGYSVDFSSSFNKQFTSLLWDFGDGSTSTAANPTHVYKAGVYKVTLSITGVDMCESVIESRISVSTPTDLNVYVSSSASGKTLSFIPHVSGGRAPYTYAWVFGDGGSSGLVSPAHTYTLPGGYGVILKVTDADGKVVTGNYNAVVTDVSACAANISFPSITKMDKRIGLSKVSIAYTDQNGVVYTSDNAAQPAASSFEIISVDEFVKNENDQPVKKLSLKFNCTLYNGARSVPLQGTEVHVGVAYK